MAAREFVISAFETNPASTGPSQNNNPNVMPLLTHGKAGVAVGRFKASSLGGAPKPGASWFEPASLRTKEWCLLDRLHRRQRHLRNGSGRA